MPELPSLNETVPGIVMDGFFAIVAPAGTPADVVARLNREIARYLEGSDIRERLLAIGLATEGGAHQTTAQAIRREQELWRALAKELGVEPQ